MCVLSIKVPIAKKSGNLFNDPRTKTRRSTDNSHQKRYREHDGQQSENNSETKMGRNNILWAF